MNMIEEKYYKTEISYIKHFSVLEEKENLIRFVDKHLEQMYMHNFTLIKNKEKLKELFIQELIKRENEKKEFLRIETYFPMNENDLNLLPAKFEKTIYDFFKIKTENYQYLHGNNNCQVVKADTLELLTTGLEASLLSAKETMGDFAYPRTKRKEQIYRRKDSKIHLYVCLYQGKVVGTCELMIDDNLAKIEDFDVLSLYQRKGFGTAIVKELLKICYDNGIQEAYLITDHDDTAKDMYKKCGFIKIGEKMEIYSVIEKSTQ